MWFWMTLLKDIKSLTLKESFSKIISSFTWPEYTKFCNNKIEFWSFNMNTNFCGHKTSWLVDYSYVHLTLVIFDTTPLQSLTNVIPFIYKKYLLSKNLHTKSIYTIKSFRKFYFRKKNTKWQKQLKNLKTSSKLVHFKLFYRNWQIESFIGIYAISAR